MIKTIIPITLILYQTNPLAEPIAYAPNVTGGYTVLTNKDCASNIEHLQAYATNEKGDRTLACWYIKDDFVYFLPKSGILRRLPIEQFEVMPPPIVKKKSRVNV
jgi:hypothetical protein